LLSARTLDDVNESAGILTWSLAIAIPVLLDGALQ
jgi:hypothetical protein